MVTFRTKKIEKAETRTRNRAIKRKIVKKKRVFSSYLLKFLLFIVLLATIAMIVGGFVLYNKIIKPLPPISKLKDLEIAQTSSIYDRKGNLLYSVYKEKRTYIDFDQINTKMINAIVAGEDQRFWTNPGFDLIGLVRAGINGAITGKVEGTSTISQQLIKNTFLTNERRIERKIKEIYLSYKMNNEFTKEKIMELYLNKIAFGNNAHGVEQAAQTYFNKKADEVLILEAAILASLPKGPTFLSPYKFIKGDDGQWQGYPRLMGYPYFYPKSTIEGVTSGPKKQSLIEKNLIEILPNNPNEEYTKYVDALRGVIDAIKIKRLQEDGDSILVCGLKKENFKGFINVDDTGCSVITYPDLLPLLNNIRILVDDHYVEYQTGRKDFILGRMIEDKYINLDEYKKSLRFGILFDFHKVKEKIKYPHFVFYVKEYLEEKYGKKAMEEGGLKIITTLDPDIQDKAQEIVTRNSNTNKWKYGANNAAAVSIDNETGEIVAMVGGTDYYNEGIGGENNIITSKLQPGSTFKPFVYALAIEKNQIGPKTPVFDVKTRFPGAYEPSNFDGKFKNKMTIEEALNHSRNIPAIKMYYLAGKEDSVINFMKDLGVDSYYEYKKYYRKKYGREYNFGAPMALGTGEMTPLELATAYSTISGLGQKREITPILKMYDAKGNVIEDPNRKNSTEAISPSTAYMITSILTNTKARPEYWNKFLSLPGRSVAAKTGTSTKQYEKKGVKFIFPQNLWTAGYTPQYTTVAWVGNTDGKELYDKGNGLEGAGPIWRELMLELHKGKEIKEWARPNSIKEVGVSIHSGKLPTKGTPANAIVRGLFINVPTLYDKSYFSQKVDSKCNGKVGPLTPASAIKTIYGVKYSSLRPQDPAWETPVKRVYGNGYINAKSTLCDRSSIASTMQLSATIGPNVNVGPNSVNVGYTSGNKVVKLEVFFDGKYANNHALPGLTQGSFRANFNIPASASGTKYVMVKLTDDQGYSSTITKSVTIGGSVAPKPQKDTTPPVIGLINPARGSINLNAGNNFNLRASVNDPSGIRVINVYLNGGSIASGLRTKNIIVPVSTGGLSRGKHTIRIEATDTQFNTTSRYVTINILDGAKPTAAPVEEKKPEPVVDNSIEPEL